MLKKIKQLFTIRKKSEPNHKQEIVLCIHGFGRRLEHEFDNFLLWNNGKYNFKTFPIYHIQDEKDNNPDVWIQRCEKEIERYQKEGYEVSLLGFSMGGVLASHLAAKYGAKKLFLIAPAFDYLHVGNIVNTAVNKLKKPASPSTVILPSSFTSTFMEVVKRCKEDIEKVNCPICIIHGDKDETIPLRSSLNAYEKVKTMKKLWILHEGKHRMMLHENTAWECWQLFNLFMDDKIITSRPIFAKDIFNEK